ncbi:MAG TPA: hypothetical protein VL742_04015 [Casimicrobiaceae bacterium]|nr:hypothetical protein [Casimicrobiaceae bacterium]
MQLVQLCGEVVETDHLEAVSGTSMDGTGFTWTDIERQVWIRSRDGRERKFAFPNVDVPARTGHWVTLLLDAERPVALINFSTKQYVNLVKLKQFELFGATEAFAFAALLVAAGFMAPAGLVILSIGTIAYGLIKDGARRHRYRQAFALVEAQIRRLTAHPPVDFSR